ncbi:transposase domain-containing protein [Streptococcus ovis]
MEELLAIIKQQATVNQQLTNEIALLREQVVCLTQKLYGKSSEKMPHLNGQLSLFEENAFPEEDGDLPSRN